ncbi:octaprenyl diphosphate synthase [Candidatus Palibaumannia cicadellinicola]|uniref:Octaprenyl diphosphate synthase n=1 Tax=Candidatus Palibaumannia cicadellinicola TaxID=186490 RepID=A0A088MYV9_9GAMM|nr:octaprenyl diphosphate synthase [Candidatus Baumannia cicadellinicola]AIN47565.1 Octaprenyl diphosphate synthase [Candidatus Baumannia cicadellinicola]
MNIKQILEIIASDMANVDTMIYEQLNSDIVLINKLGHYIISGRGKRIRPMIVVLIARALNYDIKQHVTVAALIEFIHTATLLHDDVVDESNMRRGKASANATFGNAASVLVGDFIYTRAFQMIIALESLRVLKLMSEAVNIIVEGEVLQLMNCHDPDITIENYMQIIYNKTAKLFEVASQSSAILAGALPYQEVALRDYGRYLGTAFQLIDDLLDYGANGNRIGKNTGDDLNEGKSTLPLLHAMHNGTPVQTSLIRQVIVQGNGRNFMEMILETMHQCGSLEYTRKCAEEEADKAITCLTCLSPSPYRDALENLAHLIVQRSF